MARNFAILMAGLIFALIDINLNRLVLLPGFIGFILIAFASHDLTQYASKFRIVRNLALPLVPLSLIAWLAPLGVAQPLLLIHSILTIILMCFLLGAVMQFTSERHRPDLTGHALTYRRIYIGIAIGAFLIQWAAQIRPEDAQGFVGVMAVAILGILIFILRLLYVVRQDLALGITN